MIGTEPDWQVQEWGEEAPRDDGLVWAKAGIVRERGGVLFFHVDAGCASSASAAKP